MKIHSVCFVTLTLISVEDDDVAMIDKVNNAIEIHHTDGSMVQHFNSPLWIKWIPDEREIDGKEVATL